MLAHILLFSISFLWFILFLISWLYFPTIMTIKILPILQKLNSSTTCFTLTLAKVSLVFFIQEGKRISNLLGIRSYCIQTYSFKHQTYGDNSQQFISTPLNSRLSRPTESLILPVGKQWACETLHDLLNP